MNLLSPASLYWLLLAAPVVVFYLLKIRLRRIPVSTVMFWNQIYEEKKPRSIWQKLRHLISLLLQLLFLALLVFAISEPYFMNEDLNRKKLVVILDCSASMNANDVKPDRLSVGKQKIHEIIKSLRQNDEMSLIAAGMHPRIVCGMTGHQKTLRESLDSVLNTDEASSMEPALKLARNLIEDQPQGEIILISDGSFPDSSKVSENKKIVLIPVGKKDSSNVGITQFQVRRSLNDPLGYEILIEAINYSSKKKDFRIELELNEEVVDVIPLKLKAEEKWTEVFNYISEEGGILTATVNQEDFLSCDNKVQAILPERKKQKVLLVTDGNHYLERVFEAMPLVDLNVVNELPESIPENHIIVYHKKTPPNIPDGKVLLIEPTGPSQYWNVQGIIESPIVAEQDKKSELMENVRLDNVIMPETHRLILKENQPVHPLVKSATGDLLYFNINQKQNKVLVLTVNLDKGDLPLRTAFPIMVSNALSWFSGKKGEFMEALSTGNMTEIKVDSLKLKSAVTEEFKPVLKSPSGDIDQIVLKDKKLITGILQKSGVWQVGYQVKDDKVFPVSVCCNLSSSEESNIRVPENFQSEKKHQISGLGGRPVWMYLILIAIILTMCEWFLYQRRWIN